MDWSPEDLVWFDICHGRRCRRCEETIAAPAPPGMRYCRSCTPFGAAEPHAVHVHVDHSDGWMVHFVAAGPELFVVWLARVTDDRLQRMIDRAVIAPSERADIPRALRAWGRTSFYIHMNEAQFANLRRAFRDDPRNGYEKLNHPPGRA